MKNSLRTILTILFVVFLLAVVTFLLCFRWLINTPVNPNGTKSLFEVKSGESTFQIAEHLKTRDLIKSDWAFFVESKMKSGKLVPGVYELSSKMNIIEIFKIISNGDTKIIKVTIPEGYRTEQIAQLLAKDKIVEYEPFINKAKAYDGKLFPDTYFLSPDNTVDEIISMMTDNFEDRISGLNVSASDLIIASIVEREATTDSDRALIAGIYKNRLAKKMHLESDPTVRYALDDQLLKSMSASDVMSFGFWKQKVILSEVRSLDSPYNTYFVSGLPAGPICNPGLSSIKATLNYDKNDYLYFLNDANGKIYPAKTLVEHNKNVAEILGTN